MALPTININIKNTIYAFEEDGALLYEYRPLQNLKIEKTDGTIDLTSLTLDSFSANIDINKPITLDTELSYDGSTNIIVNDNTNPLRLINSRFYLTDYDHYKIGDRKGNVDTNIYTRDDFDIESRLIKSVKTISSLDFLGIEDGGKMPVGNYHFYFKLADADGNETDFISESGEVVCHVGNTNDPKSIRGGLLQEDSNKLIKFKLNNIDLAYDYINVYYTVSSGDHQSSNVTAFKIADKFKVNGLNTNIFITGYEEHIEISIEDINIKYTTFDAAETNENCQDIMFVGNVTKNYDIYKILEKYSLLITPELAFDENIGNLTSDYVEMYQTNGYEYYNAKNIYYKLGLWDEEIYRFGIVYIMNDFTLSPIFNIRGVNALTDTYNFTSFYITDTINIANDYSIEKNPLENSKGVIRINRKRALFNDNSPIYPTGVKFNFSGDVISGGKGMYGLNHYTKGFFIVRQKRIPTILAQGVAIGTSSKAYIPIIKSTDGYMAESFLTLKDNKPILGKSFFEVTDYTNNALLCPEVDLRTTVFNNYFNSAEYVVKEAKYKSNNQLFTSYDDTVFKLGNLITNNDTSEIVTNLLSVEPGIELINNEKALFSSRAGLPIEAWKHSDPILGDINEVLDDTVNDDEIWWKSVSKIRGDFNTYVGSTKELKFGQHYNIFQKNYSINKMKDYFKVRQNDSSPFMAVSDRFSWKDIKNNKTIAIYRGDCYINTYTHRVNWNFVDPELPTNYNIVDPWTWYKNYRVKTTKIEFGANDLVVDNTGNDYSGGTVVGTYKKVLPIFTWKDVDEDGTNISAATLTMPDSKHFKKYSEANGTFGTESINRGDVNAVPLGHWVTFKVCSNINLAMRDIDFTRPEEEAVHKNKRKFHPLEQASSKNKLPESSIINNGISKTLSNRYYFEIPDVPFIKDSFTTRIYYSDILQGQMFKNGHRVFKAKNYTDYTIEYGDLVKLIEWYGNLVAVMEHGIMVIPVNERAMMNNELGKSVYINTDKVLPKNPIVLSNAFGSIWHDAIIKTDRFIYGLDTVAKKIWRTDGKTFEIISDLKVQKFLNDNILLRDIDNKKIPGTNSIKVHYNAFKKDILFVFVYTINGEEKKWHLCWNELLNKWVTRFSWFPEFSENIDNIFYTFANRNIHNNESVYLYKHGFAGNIEEKGEILPTTWYDKQYSFEYEFIVIGVQGIQKIFNNLKIISNLTKPNEFYYEIVGEGYDWSKYKKDIYTFTSDAEYISFLQNNINIPKVPYILASANFTNSPNPNSKITDINLERDNKKVNEVYIQSYHKGLDIREIGRLRGNMEYVEDFWDVQIQPLKFKYAYLINNTQLAFTDDEEMRIRDKYIKIRVKYDGTEYAIINALKTFFTVSFA